MAQLNVVTGTPGASNAGQADLTRDQVAKLAGSIAEDLYSIRKLAFMAISCGDQHELGAIGSSIASLASGSGYMADLINEKHGGTQVVGDAHAWLMPPHLEDLQS
jgi:hypothetical protein